MTGVLCDRSMSVLTQQILPLEIHQTIRNELEKMLVCLARIAVIDSDYLSLNGNLTDEAQKQSAYQSYASLAGEVANISEFVTLRQKEITRSYQPENSPTLSEELILKKSASSQDSQMMPEVPDLQKAKSHLQSLVRPENVRPGLQKSLTTNSAFEVFSKYLSIKTPLGLSKQRSEMLNEQRDLFTFSFESIRPRRKLSRGDLFKEYKSRLDFKYHKYPVDFNIIYCSSPLSWDRLLFGVKTRSKKQELVQMDLATKSCNKILSVGMIIDIITFGELIVVAERNEPIRVFRDRVHLLSLEHRFQAKYCKNAYGNDSRIFHAYKSEKLFYLTEANKIAEHSVLNCFNGRLIDIPKSSLFECICVVDENLYAVSAIGELVQYCITGNLVTQSIRVPKAGYTYCTVVGRNNKLLVSGHLSQGPQTGAILYIYSTENLSLLQEMEFPGLRYPLHKFIYFEYFNVRNWAVLHKDATSSVFLFGESNGELRKITELKFSNVMLYDINFHSDRLYCLGWEEQDAIQAVEFGLISLE